MKQNNTSTAQTAQHTPGPWEIYGYDKSDIRPATKAGKNRIVAQCPGYKAERQANARLIAASPELLSALENLYARAFSFMDKSATHDGIENCKVLGDARAAIAKATA